MKASEAGKTRKALVVLYDGYCPVCRRSAEVIRRMDLLGIIGLRKYQDFPLADLPVPLEKLGKRIHACDTEMKNCHEGIYAFAAILIRIPPMFIPALFCYGLGIAGIGQKIYDFISNNRYNLPFSGISRLFLSKLEE